jgi:hypothetical protein
MAKDSHADHTIFDSNGDPYRGNKYGFQQGFVSCGL